MTESEFQDLAEETLDTIEQALEKVAETTDLDLECSRNGNILEVELIDNSSKIIINSQAAMQEIWVAAKAGGFHFKRDSEQWIDTRDGSELFTSLSRLVSQQAGQAVSLAADTN